MKKIQLPTIYSQWDSKWSNDILGFNATNSGFDIYNYGCLITCIAMVLEYYGKKETPKDVNEDFRDSNGFPPNSGNYVWGSAQKTFKQIKEEVHTITPYSLTDEQMQEIRGSLDIGYPVMVELDYNPKTVKLDMHFVLIVGYNPADENDFVIIDPLGGVERSLKHYLGWFRPNARKTIESYTIFKGEIPIIEELKDRLIDFDDPEGKRRTVMWYIRAWFDQKTDKQNQKEEFEKELKRKDETFLQNASLLTTATKEVARKEVKIQELSGKILTLEQENARLIDQNASLFNVVDLIRMTLSKITR